MARATFMEQLRALGFEPSNPEGDRVVIDFEIPVGPRLGERVRLGLQVADDWSRNPPSGPHVSPQLLPLGGGSEHPNGGIHASPFGSEWQYWSRPCRHWDTTDRTARAYMAHIRRLFETL